MALGGRKYGTAGNGVLNGSQTAGFSGVRNPVSAKTGGSNTAGSRPRGYAGGGTSFNERTGHVGNPQVKINPFKPVPPLNPRDSQYGLDIGQNVYDYTNQLAVLNNQSKQLEPAYNLGAAGIQHGYDTSMYNTNAALASRGLLNSGGAQNAGIARNAVRGAAQSQLESQYGTGARAGIESALGALSAQYGAGGTGGLAGNQAEINAANRYRDLNPFGSLAAPQQPTPVSIANYKGPAGFYKAPGSASGYRFINKAGAFTNTLHAPGKNHKLIANPMRGY